MLVWSRQNRARLRLILCSELEISCARRRKIIPDGSIAASLRQTLASETSSPAISPYLAKVSGSHLTAAATAAVKSAGYAAAVALY